MSELRIGKVITTDQKRDAIHVAVAPVTAKTRLTPGQHVGLDTDGRPDPDEEPVGIIDPFLRHEVLPGWRVWLFLYPNTITAIRHDWSHPAFDERGSCDEQALADEYRGRVVPPDAAGP